MAKGRHIDDTIQILMGIAHPRSRIRQTAPIAALSFSPLLQDILGPLPSVPPPFVWFLRQYLLRNFLSYLGSFATAKKKVFGVDLRPNDGSYPPLRPLRLLGPLGRSSGLYDNDKVRNGYYEAGA